MTSVLHRLGGLGARHPWRVIGAWMLVVVAVGALSVTYGGEPTQSVGVPGSDSQRAFDLLEERFPEQFGGRARVVFAVDGDRDITAPSYRASIEAVLEGVRDAPGVLQVIDPFGPAAAFFVSPDSRTAFAEVVYEVKAREVSDSEIEALIATGSLAEEADLTIGFGGEVVEQLEPEQSRRSELIGLSVAVIVLLAAFGSVLAMAAPLLNAILGVALGLAAIRLVATVLDISEVAPTLASMIGIAVGIDYALFVVARHRQHLAEGHDLETFDCLGQRHGRAVRRVRRRDRGHRHPGLGPHRRSAHRHDGGGGVPHRRGGRAPGRHPAARPARSRRLPHRPLPSARRPSPRRGRRHDIEQPQRAMGPAREHPSVVGARRRTARADHLGPPRPVPRDRLARRPQPARGYAGPSRP